MPKYILGIDVGGTKIAAGLVDKNHKVSKVAILPTSQTDLTKQLVGLIESYGKFDAIALAVPGQVLQNGQVTRLPNIQNFQPTNFKRLIEKKFRVPAQVLNDAKAFALAEALVGSGKNFKVVAGVILGTGVGVGIVINGKIYFGKDSLAGELEHVTLLDGKMFRYHRHQAGKFKNAYDSRKYLKTLFSMLILSFNPDLIVLSGGWSRLPGMKKVANEAASNVGGYKNTTPVKISKIKFPGIIGAVLGLKR